MIDASTLRNIADVILDAKKLEKSGFWSSPAHPY
jgi:hypothetical protein